MIHLALLLGFMRVGVLSVGGGYVAIPLIQQLVTANGWMTTAEFADLVTIAQMTPGPILVNAATFCGMRIGGFAGALTATAGSILPSLLIVSLLALLYERCRKMTLLQSVLACLRPAVVSLVASAAWSIWLQVTFAGGVPAFGSVHWTALLLAAGGLVLLRTKKAGPIAVILLCGAANVLLGLVGAGV